VAQCGGKGNVQRFHDAARQVAAEEPYAEHLAGWSGPWNFASAEETAERLARAGFTEVDTWLEPYPVTPPDPTGFLRTVCLGPHLEQLPEDLRAGFVDAVRDRSGTELDYVRLNIDAKKPSYRARNRAVSDVRPPAAGSMLTFPSPGGIFRQWQGCLSAF